MAEHTVSCEEVDMQIGKVNDAVMDASKKIALNTKNFGTKITMHWADDDAVELWHKVVDCVQKMVKEFNKNSSALIDVMTSAGNKMAERSEDHVTAHHIPVSITLDAGLVKERFASDGKVGVRDLTADDLTSAIHDLYNALDGISSELESSIGAIKSFGDQGIVDSLAKDGRALIDITKGQTEEIRIACNNAADIVAETYGIRAEKILSSADSVRSGVRVG